MPKIVALLHTENDFLRIGRCLETLYPCDEIIVVDHGSRDGTVQVAREYDARVIEAVAHAGADHYFRSTNLIPSESRIESRIWALCIDPRESVSESLGASLYEWKTEAGQVNAQAFSVFVREETEEGWVRNPVAQTRLVPLDWNRWSGWMPGAEPSAVALEGELLRFVFP
jgi:glycosyltransferase involved in cell wall biosynthesis